MSTVLLEYCLLRFATIPIPSEKSDREKPKFRKSTTKRNLGRLSFAQKFLKGLV